MRKIFQLDNLDTRNPDNYVNNTELKESEEGNLVSSIGTDGLHYPVIDFDFPCRLVPSRTEGCYHLYIDQAVDGYYYGRILETLHEAGLVEKGVLNQWERQGATFVRREGTFKPHSRSLAEKTAARLTAAVKNIKDKYSKVNVNLNDPIVAVDNVVDDLLRHANEPLPEFVGVQHVPVDAGRYVRLDGGALDVGVYQNNNALTYRTVTNVPYIAAPLEGIEAAYREMLVNWRPNNARPHNPHIEPVGQ